MLISGIKLNIDHSDEDLKREIRKKYGKPFEKFVIRKKSVDARFGKVNFVYSVEILKKGESEEKKFVVPKASSKKPPIVVGSGPCGLFCAYILSLSGLCPILIERGQSVDERIKDVNNFWSFGKLNVNSNVQFGEGGAGTFSDGKLTTQISDPLCKVVLDIFCECGADEEIKYLAKPHLGTDNLVKIVKNLREKIIENGGQVHFNETVTDIIIENERVVKVIGNREYDTDLLVLAIGHSARDTFKMLFNKGINMSAKAFSVGARIEHLQKDINLCQYGKYADHPKLSQADYKLSYHDEKGRGAYTFCMCPGGLVVASSSEENGVVTNGMSYHDRAEKNANSAFLVGVTPNDFGTHPLDGVKFQKDLEKKAFSLGGGEYMAPCQRLGDFIDNKPTTQFGAIEPSYLPGVTPNNLREILPPFVTLTMEKAVFDFSRKLKCFSMGDAVLTGVETRSSSPVRISRNSDFVCNIDGIYPAGEGAGYAGGIMSASVDGIKCAMAIIKSLKDGK